MFIFLVQALNIDESLYLKIVNISSSKKTISINRGSADGLNLNEHASFIIDEGIVAKGVLSRISQYASLWQIYSINQGDFLAKDRILNLKIIPPVKLTVDASKQLIQDDISTGFDPKDPNPGKIALVEGADDLGSFNALDDRGFEKRSEDNKSVNLLAYGNFRGTKDNNALKRTYSIGGLLGFEMGSKKNKDFLSKFTISIFGQGDMQYEGVDPGFKYQLNYGGGLSIALNFPHITETNKPILYTSVGGVYFVGSKVFVDESKSSLSLYGPSLGLGMKYYSSSGFGVKLGVEGYYLWNKEVLEDKTELTDQFLRLNFLAGISFRF